LIPPRVRFIETILIYKRWQS